MASHLKLISLVTILFVTPSLAQLSIRNWTWVGQPGTGRDYWHEIPDTSCNGSSQSPIDIDTSTAVPVKYDPFSILSYGIVMNAELENNGRVLEVDLHEDGDDAEYYEVSGGGLPGIFRALQLHFHFGSVDAQGSEHTVDGRQFPAEMHIVHYDTAYPNTSEAMKHKGGIAVLGFFLEEGETHNPALDVILDAVQSIEQPHKHVEIHSLQLANLLPSSLDYYWRYEGSLTTPGCYEIVTWTVFNVPIMISKQQLQIMRTLISVSKDVDDQPIMMADNYRDPQDLNGRTVYSVTATVPTTLPATQTTAAAAATAPNVAALSLAVLVTFFLRRA